MRFRPKSTDGVSQRSLLTAAMHPAKKFSFSALDRCSDSHLFGVSAVELAAPPALISGSPMFLFFKLTSSSGTISFRFPDVSSLIAPPLSTISCSILARHSCVLPAIRPYLSKMLSQKHFLHVCRFPTHPLVGLLVSAACSILGHSKDCQPTDSIISNPKHYHLPDVSHCVSSSHLWASTAEIHLRGQEACRQKLPACSTWLHPQNGFAPITLLQMVQLLQSCPCLGYNHKAFSRLPSLGNCLQHMHSVVPSSPSTHDPVQLLSCISLRRLIEMPEAVPELSIFFVLHDPSSVSILLALQSRSELWIDTI